MNSQRYLHTKEKPKSLLSMCALCCSYINIATTRLMDLKIGYGEHISSLKIIEQRQSFTRQILAYVTYGFKKDTKMLTLYQATLHK